LLKPLSTASCPYKARIWTIKWRSLRTNKLTEQLASKIMESGNTDLLIMSAGPYRHYSCLSAYCVDAQEMADAVGMTCWGIDDKIR